MPNWEENIRSSRSLLGERRFRNRGAIYANYIGEQFFCEMKVELELTHGKVETEDTRVGTLLHEELLDMNETTIENIIECIKKEKICCASFSMVTKFEDIYIGGTPDLIIFQYGRPTYVVELKTTKGDLRTIYRSEKVQTVIYCFLLDLIGFDCSDLKVVLVKVRRDTEITNEEKSKFLGELCLILLSRKYQQLNIANNCRVHVYNYNRSEALDIIEQTKGFWLGEREPIPTTNPNRCRSCRYNQICPSSLAK